MRINSKAHACHGLETLSVNGKICVPGMRSTAPDWLDDRPGAEEEAIFQRELPVGSEHWELAACNIKTQNVRPLEPNISAISRQGATVIYGGAGVWAAQTSAGIRSNVHTFQPIAGLWGVGRDGCLGYCERQQSGTGIVFRAIDGTELKVEQNTPMHDVHIVSFGVAAYVHSGKLYTIGVPAPVTVPEEIFEPRLLHLYNDTWAVGYHTQNRLLFQPLITAAEGYVVWNGAGTFSPDWHETSPHCIRGVWSTTEAEGPTRFRSTGGEYGPDLDIVKMPVQPLTLPPVPPPTRPDRPRVTIVSYQPQAGRAPMTVRAVRGLSGGPAMRLYWLRRQHAPNARWETVANNPASDPDHHFQFDEPGVYEIAVEVTGPGGSDRTGAVRLVTVL